MRETVDFLRTWHHGRESEGEAVIKEDGACTSRRSTQFEKKLEAFEEMWTGSFSGKPKHKSNRGTRADAVEKMASTFIALLLTTLPAIPAPNKWTKIFRVSDFVGLGTLVNNFLPSIFELAFQPIMFKDTTDTSHQEEDPRLVEGLFFHAVQGKRYHATKTCLTCGLSQWCCRCWLLVSEHLRRLVYHWLHNLQTNKKASQRFPVCALLDVRTSVAFAVLQNICHQLLDTEGRARLCMVWQTSGFTSYTDWCAARSEEVASLRRALMSLSGWIFRRHVLYFDQFPWSLLCLIDPEADESVVKGVQQKWDGAHPCCLNPGLARELKKLKVSGDELATDSKWRSVLRGYAQLMQLTIADVETKHALSRHWADRPYPTIVAKYVNREACVCVEEAKAYVASLHQNDATDAVVPTNSVGGGTVRLHAKQVRGQAAEMLFRTDFHATLKMASPHVPVNPCSKEFRVEAKQAWEALSVERKEYYEEMSRQSHARAQQRRAERRSKQAAGSAPVPADQPERQVATDKGGLLALPLPDGSPDFVAPYNPWLLASDAASCADIPAMAEQIKSVVHKAKGQDLNLVDEVVRDSPISQSQLDAWWRTNLAQKHTWADALRQFNVESQRFTVPPGDDQFPERVQYHGFCGELCRTYSCPNDIMLFQKLLQAFDSVVAKCGDGTTASATKSDILLRIRLHAQPPGDDETCCYESFKWLTALSARSGVHPSSQIFVSLDVAERVLGGRTKLRLRALPAVHSELPWCSSLLDVGPLHHVTEQTVAKTLLGLYHDHGASFISLTRMAFRDINLSTVEVSGAWEGWQPLVVQGPSAVATAGDAGEDPCLDDDDDDQDVQDEPEVANAGNGFDLLGMVSAPVPRAGRRGKGKGKGRGKLKSSQVRNSLVAAMPFDASLQGDLERQLQQVLEDEQIMLPEAVGEAPLLEQMLQDPVMIETIAASSAADLCDAVQLCTKAQPASAVPCAFAESDDEQILGDSVDADLEVEPVDVQPHVTAQDSDQEQEPSSSSTASGATASAPATRTTPTSTRPMSRPGTKTSPSAGLAETQLGKSANGHDIYLLESKHGNTPFEVWEKVPGSTTVLGKVSIMNFAAKPVYRATCKIHRNCCCISNGLEESKLIDWLCVASSTTAQENAELSREVRISLGMKIRAKQ
eukprot:s2155_g10.t1